MQSSRRLLRDTLSACLAIRPDITVVGKVAEPDEVLALCELRRPDVVILDAGPRLGEISLLVSKLKRHSPELNVVVTYREATEQDLAAACRAGAASLVPESHGLTAVLALLRPSRGRHAKNSQRGLTDRELETLRHYIRARARASPRSRGCWGSARSRWRTSSAACTRSWR